MDEERRAYCGTPASPGARYCEACDSSLPPPHSLPKGRPPSRLGRMAHSVETPYQGVAIRFVQYLIDAIILGIVSSFVTVPFRSSVSVNTTTGTVSIGPGYGFGIAIAFIIELLYFTLLSGRYAQSVGMMAVRIKVVREADFGKISYGAALARTIFLLIDAIPFVIPYLIGAILIWSSDKKQRLGDRVARTVVIKT